MRVFRTVRTAMRALGRNIMRSVLTTLGIIIGITAVIAITEIGNGASTQMRHTMESLGANNLRIESGSSYGRGASSGSGGRITLTVADCDAIVEHCPSIRMAAPIVSVGGQAIYGNNNWPVDDIYGSTPAFFDVRDWAIIEGEPFTDRDVMARSAVCVVGQTLVRELFKGQSPVGKELRLSGVNLRVVGVLEPKGASMFGSDQDDILVAPWTTIKDRVSNSSGSSRSSSSAASSSSSSAATSLNDPYPSGTLELYPQQSAVQKQNNPMPVRFANVSMIYASATAADRTQTAVVEITELLKERHRIRAGDENDFRVRDMTELGNAMGMQSSLMTTLLLIVAGISLLVGGVGIMNIMMVSVTERTREIGLRMAVGARSRDILIQFLIEAIMLCVLGGLIGIVFGKTASYLVWYFNGWATATSLPAIVVSLIVSAFVGIAFGMYPAYKASRLDPIDALRYE